MIAARDDAYIVPGSCQLNGQIAANCTGAINAEFHMRYCCEAGIPYLSAGSLS
jgi:hypothetical protein